MNDVCIAGTICEKPIFSHESYERKFFGFSVACERLSGTKDVIRCIVSEKLVNEIRENEKLEIYGRLNSKSIDGKLLIFVFVTSVSEYEMDKNDVEISGFVCKEVVLRQTPNGRNISDFMIAAPREIGKHCDYIPCIAWGGNAFRAKGYVPSTQLSLKGRLQSREYNKVLDDEHSETRTAYELSINKMAVIGGNSNGI